MDAAREQELVGQMNQLDVAGVPFAQAKQQLLAKGYSEAEIVYCLYSAPFDGKANTPRPANPLQKLYQDQPEKAQRVAATLLAAEAEKHWAKTAGYAAAASFAPNTQTSSYYTVRMADHLGLPYYTFFGVGLLIMAVIIKFQISPAIGDVILLLYANVITAIFVFTFIKERWRLHKLHQQAKRPLPPEPPNASR